MKHKISKRAVLVLAMCVACVLAFGTSLAQADIDSNLGGTNKLQLVLQDQNPESDVNNASMQDAKIYKVASVSKDQTYDTYNYTFDVQGFTELGNGFNPATVDWQDMAKDAKEAVDGGNIDPVATMPVGETLTGLPDGLYFVDIPNARSTKFEYEFTAGLVTLPGKVDANNNPVYNTAYGRWTNTEPVVPVKAEVKYETTRLFGSLQINKSVIDSSGNPIKNGEPASFVFHITGEGCDEYVTAQFDGTTVTGGIIGHIPAGIPLTVTEVNSGAAYQVVGESSKPVTVYADTDPAVVEFQNTPNGSGKIGYGVENHYVYDGDDWNVTQRTINASENTTK